MTDIEEVVKEPKGFGEKPPVVELDLLEGSRPQVYGPKVPVYEENVGKDVKVDTAALLTFAKNLRQLLKVVAPAKDKIDKLPVLMPGSFFDGAELTKKVMGPGTSIKGTTFEFLRAAVDAITTIADDVERLAKDYETMEELNKGVGHNLGQHIENARNNIITAVGSATSLPPATTGSTYPPGTYPPGSYGSTYPPGTYPPDTYPPDTYPPGTYPPGTYPPGTTDDPNNPPPPA